MNQSTPSPRLILFLVFRCDEKTVAHHRPPVDVDDVVLLLVSLKQIYVLITV